MAFCTKCGNQLDDSSFFCPVCGTRVDKPIKEQNSISSSVVFKYKKNPIFLLLTEPLNVTLDEQLNFKVREGQQVSCNVQPGNHTFVACVPYLGNTKYGKTTKTFYIGANETLEIEYKPPAAVFMSGNITIRKMNN
ncbi:zinc-ribbon domain-containing protein [Clostridium sp.]|uniref:zinc-ribbon domain-containing protein n=1 Tax=Clostridium sp. TaxID=1506 RepID=UPI0026027136|nr:zinc-ribbon domain-containing protein [Clostridium sp.]